MDQQPKMQREEEEEEGSLKESTGRRTEEEEPVDRREEEEKKGPQEPTTHPREAAADEEKEKEKEDKERSSDEDESMAAAAAVFLHPCSLLQYVVRALACRLGISDPFGGTGTKPSADSAAPPLGPSEEGQDADQKNPGTATVRYTTYVQFVV